MPSSMVPSLTLNSGSLAPGSVQPAKAAPKVRVMALARRATRATESRSSPRSAAAPAVLKTKKSPATPRRSLDGSTGAPSTGAGPLATSSVTRTVRVSTPSAARRRAASPKCMTSPA